MLAIFDGVAFHLGEIAVAAEAGAQPRSLGKKELLPLVARHRCWCRLRLRWRRCAHIAADRLANERLLG
jgi:hypothetical protein